MLQPILRTTFEPQNYTGRSAHRGARRHRSVQRDRAGRHAEPAPDLRLPPAQTRTSSACARRILETLAARAYRRPLTSSDRATLVRFYDLGRAESKGGSFDAGIEMGLRRILASPDFVLRIERDPERRRAGSLHRVSDLELASRLSFFLWSTLPDDELLQRRQPEPA